MAFFNICYRGNFIGSMDSSMRWIQRWGSSTNKHKTAGVIGMNIKIVNKIFYLKQTYTMF